MVRKTITTALISAGLALGTFSSSFAADPKLMMGANTEMLSYTCAGCHGPNGASGGPATPTIAGISKDYFVELMQGFASGDVPGTIMGRIAQGYTEEEIVAMSEYFGNKKFVKAKQNFDDGLVKKGAKLHDKYCEKCHSEGGQSAEDDSGILAGQWQPYLHATMADFIEEHREAPKKMKKKLKKMLEKEGDPGLEALFAYYASQQ